jgi:hypothetical protein
MFPLASEGPDFPLNQLHFQSLIYISGILIFLSFNPTPIADNANGMVRIIKKD